MFKKQARKSDRPAQDRIAEAAMSLFAAKGYDGVPLRAIADAARVPVGLIPYYFGSKAGLYRALWESWMGRVPADTLLRRSPLRATASVEARARFVVRAFFEGPRSLLLEPGGDRFVAIMVREAHDPSAASRGLVREFILPNASRFRAEFKRLFPALDARAIDAGFAMTVAALRIVIEREPLAGVRAPDRAEVEQRFAVLTEFVVGGWLRLRSAGARTMAD